MISISISYYDKSFKKCSLQATRVQRDFLSFVIFSIFWHWQILIYWYADVLIKKYNIVQTSLSFIIAEALWDITFRKLKVQTFKFAMLHSGEREALLCLWEGSQQILEWSKQTFNSIRKQFLSCIKTCKSNWNSNLLHIFLIFSVV